MAHTADASLLLPVDFGSFILGCLVPRARLAIPRCLGYENLRDGDRR